MQKFMKILVKFDENFSSNFSGARGAEKRLPDLSQRRSQISADIPRQRGRLPLPKEAELLGALPTSLDCRSEDRIFRTGRRPEDGTGRWNLLSDSR